jgi:predicted dehydrogenase
MHALIVGFGSIGERHARNLQDLRPGSRLTLVTRRPLAGGGATSVRAVSDLGPALAARPDLAVIAGKSHRHLSALEPLLQADIPCYIEKPVVADAAQAEALGRLLERLPSLPPTLVGCNLRFLPSLLRFRDLLRRGVVGKVVRASLEVGQWLPDWRPTQDYRASYSAHAEQGGGVILDLIHELDQARWLFGEPDAVHALAGKFSSLQIHAEDTACVLLGYRGGPLVTLSLDYVSRHPVRRYQAVGESGTLIWDLGERRLELVRADGSETVDCGPHGFDVPQTYATALAEFLDCVERRRASSQDVADGLRSAQLALRVKQAAGL